MAFSKKQAAAKYDFERFANDFQGLDPNDPGLWPAAPRVLVLIVLLVVSVAVVWWFDWRDQWEALETSQQKEVELREQWVNKKRQAINLDLLRAQLEEINHQFGALLKQLPNKAEVDGLLQDINQAGLGRGLQFELFKPSTEINKGFYVEMPIDVRIVGGYHELGVFASDVAKLPRIVTLRDMAFEKVAEGVIKLNGKAVTYRYLDEEELEQQELEQQNLN